MQEAEREREMATSKVVLSGVQVMAVLAVLFFLLSGSSMAADFCQGKQSWPELVGQAGEVAEPVIKGQNPFVKDVIIVRNDTKLIENFRCDRVWIFTNPDGTISRIPTVG
ncbi:glu S.griseus protease inhibitor-like isoform X1 [Nymphaea colorata]|nr:glu S.griseus protease inhibitor-like isoform X1 [Nymphaea colorata]